MQQTRIGPPTVAAPIGREADKMLQRFRELEAIDRKRLLDQALGMIERRREALLSPIEREAKRLVERVTHCLGLIEQATTTGEGNALGPCMWKDMVANDSARLRKLGITYFEAIGRA